MAWVEREVVVIVVHHHGVEDHFTQRIAAMNVVNVGIMLEIATVTGVAVEGAGAGHTRVPAQGLVPAPGTVAPGHVVAHAVALALALQKTGLLETDLGIMIVHQRTGQDPGTEVLRTGPVPETMGARVHPRTTLKAVPNPGLGQGAGVAIPWTGMATPRMMLATSKTFAPLFCECTATVAFLSLSVPSDISVFSC